MIQNTQQARSRFLMLILAAVVGGGFASAAVSADRGAEIEGGASTGAGIAVPGYPGAGGGVETDTGIDASGGADRAAEGQAGTAGDMDPALDRRDPDGDRSAVEFDATGNAIVRDKR